MVDSVFSFGELGFQEFETNRYLIDILRKNGFSVEEGVAGIPTAFIATWGSGKPVIALGSDIDGIPQASQKPGVAYHDPIIEGAPGHGEGHNSGEPLNITAAIAVKKIMEREKLPGTIRIWSGTAEELVGAKAYFVRAGLFKDVDVALFTHVDDTMAVSWGDKGSATGLVSVQYSFRGETAHAAGSPWRGRSALDAVELMDIGWNFRREHLPLEQRSHYVITDGGDQPNVVPRSASVWYYFRQTTYPKIKEMWDIGDQVAKGAAMMTGTELLPTRVLGSAWPQHFNKAVAEAAFANINRVGLPQWSDADQTLARALQKELGSREAGLTTRGPTTLQGPALTNTGGGSDDIGDVSWNVPTITLRYPANIPGLPGHNWANAISMATPIAHKGRDRGRQGPGDDDDRPAHETGARAGGVGLLPQRADQGHEVRAAHPPTGQAGHRTEQGHDGQVPRRDAEVLLRSDEVQDVPRAVGHHVSDGEEVRSAPGFGIRDEGFGIREPVSSRDAPPVQRHHSARAPDRVRGYQRPGDWRRRDWRSQQRLDECGPARRRALDPDRRAEQRAGWLGRHVMTGTHPTTIGNDVTIGHGAIVHGCTLHDRDPRRHGRHPPERSRRRRRLDRCGRHLVDRRPARAAAIARHGQSRHESGAS